MNRRHQSVSQRRVASVDQSPPNILETENGHSLISLSESDFARPYQLLSQSQIENKSEQNIFSDGALSSNPDSNSAHSNIGHINQSLSTQADLQQSMEGSQINEVVREGIQDLIQLNQKTQKEIQANQADYLRVTTQKEIKQKQLEAKLKQLEAKQKEEAGIIMEGQNKLSLINKAQLSILKRILEALQNKPPKRELKEELKLITVIKPTNKTRPSIQISSISLEEKKVEFIKKQKNDFHLAQSANFLFKKKRVDEFIRQPYNWFLQISHKLSKITKNQQNLLLSILVAFEVSYSVLNEKQGMSINQEYLANIIISGCSSKLKNSSSSSQLIFVIRDDECLNIQKIKNIINKTFSQKPVISEIQSIMKCNKILSQELKTTYMKKILYNIIVSIFLCDFDSLNGQQSQYFYAAIIDAWLNKGLTKKKILQYDQIFQQFDGKTKSIVRNISKKIQSNSKNFVCLKSQSQLQSLKLVQ